ncbi:MAG: hypothetical protein PHQ66_02835 [Candidatus Nanoarchaeia archaeon]|nr:hypothetical protein [Candidatus Nanoarchaeia archaeon]MDD5357699.1 hypothetical protein [Candidatus Nanoarchaeia archaeon]MDD5588618.1 hypothetical protein [Candidatus Nanoarchaeia archaeon]
MKKRVDKHGQFFLIAAVIIIAVIVSIVTITNYTQKRDVVRLYDLGEELGIESQQVLDYGTYSELNEEEMKGLIENFINNYVSYIEDDKNIYFVFGNKDKVNVVGYQDIQKEEVLVCLKIAGAVEDIKITGEDDCDPYLTIGETQQFTEKNLQEIDKVEVKIGGIGYEFPLNYGENFYFVIWQEIGGEKHVVTSSSG